MIWAFVLSILVGYLVGSINSSIVLSKLKKNDIRKHGSGNAGATNTLRVMGKAAAATVIVGDALKAVITFFAAIGIAKGFQLSPEMTEYCKYLAALFTVLGHNFPVFFGFKGGKGILTSTTIIYLFDWRIGLMVLLLGLALIVLTRYVSVGSMAGCVLYPMFVYAFNSGETLFYEKMHLALALVLGVLGIWRHRSNIKKLLKCEESRVGDKSKKNEESAS